MAKPFKFHNTRTAEYFAHLPITEFAAHDGTLMVRLTLLYIILYTIYTHYSRTFEPVDSFAMPVISPAHHGVCRARWHSYGDTYIAVYYVTYYELHIQVLRAPYTGTTSSLYRYYELLIQVLRAPYTGTTSSLYRYYELLTQVLRAPYTGTTSSLYRYL
jgi:hypothetical protein